MKYTQSRVAPKMMRNISPFLKFVLAVLMVFAAAAMLVLALGKYSASADDIDPQVNERQSYKVQDVPYTPLAITQSVYHDHWLLRTPGDQCPTSNCHVSGVFAATGEVNAAVGGSNSRAVRPTLFIDLSSLITYKAALNVGTCGDDVVKYCLEFGGYKFDVIGINKDNAKSGLCSMVETDGYTDNYGAQCPNNTVQILLSNSSSIKPANSNFNNNGSTTANFYFNSNLNAAMNNFYNTAKLEHLDGNAAYPTLETLTVNRWLAGGALNNSAGGNKCGGEAPGERSAFPLSAVEVTHLTNDLRRIAYNTNGATSGTAPSADYVPNGDSLTTPTAAEFDGVRTSYTFSGWSTSNTVNNTQSACPATAYAPGGTIPLVTADLTLYACWIDKTAPTLSSISATKTSDTNVRFTIDAGDALSGTATKWKLGTSAGAGDLCAERALSTATTCDTTVLAAGGETVYYTLTDLAGNVLSGDQEFDASQAYIALALSHATHGASPITTDENVQIVATVSTSPTIVKSPNGRVSITITSPLDAAVPDEDLTSALLTSDTCDLTNEPNPLANGHKSTCTFTFKPGAKFIDKGVWGIVANYDPGYGTPTGLEQLISSATTTFTPNIQTTPTYVEFSVPSGVTTASINVGISGQICQYNDAQPADAQTCATNPPGDTIKFKIEEDSGFGYTTYESADITIEADGSFDFELPQIPLAGHYHLTVIYNGSSTYETSYSQTDTPFEVVASSIGGGECSNPAYFTQSACEGASETWTAGSFSMSLDTTDTTTASLDKTLTVSLTAPTKAMALHSALSDRGNITIKLFRFINALTKIEVPNSSVTHHLTDSDCTNACSALVHNEYEVEFPQPRYINTPGTYFYEVTYSGNESTGEATLGYDATKDFEVTKASTEVSVDAITPFEFTNPDLSGSGGTAAGKMAKVNLTMPEYIAPTPIVTSKYPTDISNGQLNYTIKSLDVGRGLVVRQGTISLSDNNCTPNLANLQLGWAGCTYLEMLGNPNTRKFLLYLGKFDWAGDFALEVSFASTGSEDIAFNASDNSSKNGGNGDEFTITQAATHYKIHYNLDANGDFAQDLYAAVPYTYHQIGTAPRATPGYTPPRIAPHDGYLFVGWYTSAAPSAADTPLDFSTALAADTEAYAYHIGPLQGRCLDPQYLTEQDCAENESTWAEPGPYLTADKQIVYPGETLRISGFDFAPNEPLDLFLNSTPVYLASVNVDVSGNFCALGEYNPECQTTAASITIPLGTPAGEHSISAQASSRWLGEDINVPANVGVKVKVNDLTPNPADESQESVAAGDTATTGVSPWNILLLLSIAVLAALTARNKQQAMTLAEDE